MRIRPTGKALLADRGAIGPVARTRRCACSRARRRGRSGGEVTDLAMRVCGGAAFRKEVGVERCSAMRAPRGHGPHTDVLSTSSKAAAASSVLAMADIVLGAVAYDAKVVPIWEGFEFFVSRGLPFDFVLCSNYERQVEATCAATSTSRELPPRGSRPCARGRSRAGDRDARHGSRSTSVVLVRADRSCTGHHLAAR
jgi:hypothetical protein